MRTELFVDGRFVPATSGERLRVLDPATEELLAEVEAAGPADVDRAVDAARRALGGPWGTLAPAERGRRLLALAERIEAASEALARLESRNTGKPLREARDDLAGVVKTFRYNAGAADKLEGATIPLGPSLFDATLLEPLGVTAHILPWNFPLGMLARSLAPALAAGCTAVVKPAEETPLSALALAELLAPAGIPEGVVAVVPGTGEVAGEALCRHPGVAGITFTGSVATGRRVMALAAERAVPVVLELGGKNPLLVFADADLDRLEATLVPACFENAGQVCSAASRLLVEAPSVEDVTARLVARARALRLGPGLDDPDLGPLISAAQRARVLDWLAEAHAGGAQILTGGRPPAVPARGFFLEPTVLRRVPPDCRLAREEVFAPVVTIEPFASESEAVALANAGAYGLVAGVFTRDLARALRLARALEAGSVWVNGWYLGGQQAPVGGVKASGFGRERGLPGLFNYLRLKNLAIAL
ncbi:MAG: aldehyde dehydrogenase family protein [Geminicoccaceae bacterium]|nr:aldehyde dehydrogenase family protein [Geminicoccaceae bacterium]MDW8371106.1 aldehyde dehydrogenase family protein [Geminicoccaceae bacterium]